MTLSADAKSPASAAAIAAPAELDRRFRALIERSFDGIALLAPDGTVLYTSPSLSRILGFAPEEFLGQPVFDWIHPDDLGPTSAALRSIAETTGATVTMRCRNRHKDGSWRWLECTVSNLLDEPGVRALVSNARDISEPMQVQAELAAALRDSENIVKTIPDVLYRLDVEGRVTKWNRKAEQITGWKGSDITGLSALTFFAEEDHPRVARAIGEVLSNGYGEVEARMRHRDGTLTPYHYTGVPLHDESGRLIGMTGIGRDLTARLRAERRTKALLEVATTIAGTLDLDELLARVQREIAHVLPCDGVVIFQSDQKRRVTRPIAELGVPAELVPKVRQVELPFGQPFGGRLGQGETFVLDELSQQPGLPELFSTDLRVRTAIVAPLWVRGRNLGALVAMNCSAGAFAPDQVELARAIAQQLAVAMQAAELYGELERANRLKSDFVATMSHELRTPLNIILGYNDLVLEGEFGPLTPEQREALERVESSARTLLELITATLDMSRLDKGQLPLCFETVDTAPLLRELDREMRELYEDKPRLEFRWHFREPLPVLRTDRVKLKVVLKNLMGNAIKFTERGRIDVYVTAEVEHIEFRVADSGIGIPPEMLSVIFEPFRQVDSSMTRRHGGVGLGLHIVRRLVELLGGTIAVASTPGTGSTFTVRVPLQAG
ncbi:MAG TPA: PAS domain S-box protein [Terriglobales bacterium]|nr:PAS domain S-box protein [Terriglobales bacterium]